MIEQPELDFDPRPQPEPEHPDLRVVWWVTQSGLAPSRRVDPRHELGWWESLPSYERDRYRRELAFEESLDLGRLRPYGAAYPQIDPEVVRMNEESVQRWADDIRKAAIDGRPMPYAPSENMSGFELDSFNSRLTAACLVAGAFIVQAAPPATNPKRRK